MMVSGFVTLGGEKMSKSKGNVVEPQDVIKEYSADALRFWAAGSKLGSDLDYQENDLIAGKKFITKLWNASRFVFMNLEDYSYSEPGKLKEVDDLFLNKLNVLIKKVTESFEKYEYSKARALVEDFFWHDFCDNYLEIVKKRIYQDKTGKTSAQYTLYKSLLIILKMIAPIMPFITEEIYQEYFINKGEKDKSIHVSKWPIDEKARDFSKFDVLVKVLSRVRQEKTKKQKSMKSGIILSLGKKEYVDLKSLLDDLKDVTNAQDIVEGNFLVKFV